MSKCKTYFYGVREYTRSMGCILSRLLFVATIISLGACTDDDHLQSVDDKTPLQVTVGTSSLASRNIITDDYLPDASQIGISLFDSNGDAYDGQAGYVNAKYAAAGTGADQTWTTEQNVTVSADPATVVAYYPYNSDANLDLSKVPVEIASQTDYMFSKPLANINNTNPDAKIVLYHALTAIRVRLVLGDFTGDADVTNIAVSSPALATDAELDVYNGQGALSNITGQGETMTCDVDFTMSTQGTDTDVMFVPDVSVTEGSTTVSATIGGKKYTASISFDESYLQGYIYTYTLTLNNSGFQLTKVNVTPWQTGTEESDKLQYSFQEDDYIVKIQVPSDNYTYYHNMMGYKGIINWGDASVETIENFDDSYTESSYPSHVYEKAGTYTVRFSGTIDALYTIGSFTPIITKVIYAGNELNISDIKYAFYKQTLLTEVPEGLFDSCNNNVTNAAYTFYNCTSLQTIPADLFNDLQYVEDFTYTFEYSGLTTIPEGLFDNCVNAMYWGDDCYSDGTFAYCENLTSIPAGLFNKCTKTTLFPTVFAYCTALTNVPDDMFNGWISVQTFDGTFAGCSALASVGERAFANCSALTDFEEVFNNSGLQEIKGNIFEGSNNIGTFYCTFFDCKSLKAIPEGLFDHCTEVTNFSDAFYGCSNLTSIPGGLFDKCTEVTSFSHTFSGCSSLISIPEGLFENNKKVTSFSYAFADSGIKELSSNTFCTEVVECYFNGIFSNSKLEIVKANAFNCPNVTNFWEVFEGCANLLTIEAGAFDLCTEVTSFISAFRGCESLQVIPEGLFKNNTKVTSFGWLFYGCTSLQSIPKGLFDKCTEVTRFDCTFYNTGITNIPEGLFDNCTKVTVFEGTFSGCGSLTGESPYTVINIDGVETKVHLYERSNYPEYFTVPRYYSNCFDSCTGLTDYGSIPTEWL